MFARLVVTRLFPYGTHNAVDESRKNSGHVVSKSVVAIRRVGELRGRSHLTRSVLATCDESFKPVLTVRTAHQTVDSISGLWFMTRRRFDTTRTSNMNII